MLTDEERAKEKRGWRPFEPGNWHVLASEAAARFNAEYGAKRHVTKVFKSLYRARELIVAVQTDLASGKSAKLPESYCGFRVVQFAGCLPEGVLVEAGPPSKFPRRSRETSRKAKPVTPPTPVRATKAGSSRTLALEGEIDLHRSAGITAELRSLTKSKPEKVVIDLSNVTYIDSAGLAALIEGMRRVEAYRGKLYLAGLRKEVRLIFETSRLDQVFRIRESVGEAVEG